MEESFETLSKPDPTETNNPDSGMSSLGGSKTETPERLAEQPKIEDVIDETAEASNTAVVKSTNSDVPKEPNYDEEPDESLSERLWGLTEMFPDSVRRTCEKVTDISIKSSKALYHFSCNASWIFFTSSMILFAPVLFETERAQMAELELSQKQRVLLGPGAAMPGGGAGGMPALPPMQR
ncbi:mitochondrial import receptor subunit TOM22 homolog [Contarinia nasturtii]|uniref:mitochondrial import receptor subunit TOM22 homolog n=1 Tax=Contarinia nasturtii TaxID=265458 RepID=UPI0012D499F9|nr:mitochondrial import receptor subunit TOM22 homolog [Contarinia nasturtii]